MPDLGVELHYRRLKGVFIWYVDVYFECSALVGCARRALKRAFQFRDTVAHRLDIYVGHCISLYICQLLPNAACSMPSHFGRRGAGLDVDRILAVY